VREHGTIVIEDLNVAALVDEIVGGTSSPSCG
jgi:hypothetical protein